MDPLYSSTEEYFSSIDERFRKQCISIGNIIENYVMFDKNDEIPNWRDTIVRKEREKKQKDINNNIKLLLSDIKKKACNKKEIEDADAALKELILFINLHARQHLHDDIEKRKDQAVLCVDEGCENMVANRTYAVTERVSRFFALGDICKNIRRDMEILNNRRKKENIKNGDFSEWGVN